MRLPCVGYNPLYVLRNHSVIRYANGVCYYRIGMGNYTAISGRFGTIRNMQYRINATNFLTVGTPKPLSKYNQDSYLGETNATASIAILPWNIADTEAPAIYDVASPPIY